MNIQKRKMREENDLTAQSFAGLCSEWVIMVTPHPRWGREMFHQLSPSLVTALIYFNRTFK